jgi:hypothetical protein
MTNVDIATHDRLRGVAQERPQEVGEVSAEILCAVFAFLIGSVGPIKTAEIFRDWAAFAQRRLIGEAHND